MPTTARQTTPMMMPMRLALSTVRGSSERREGVAGKIGTDGAAIQAKVIGRAGAGSGWGGCRVIGPGRARAADARRDRMLGERPAQAAAGLRRFARATP